MRPLEIDEEGFDLEDGKYTVILSPGKTEILRYGEPWRDATGDKFIYLMAARVVELEDKVQELQNHE